MSKRIFKGAFFGRIAAGLPAAILMLILAPNLAAQVTGRINGYVRDPSGLPIPSAVVTAVSAQQQLQRTAPTDESGFYNLLAIPAGLYRITVEAAGFDKQVQSGVQLTSGESLRLDVQLAIGKIQTEVTVASTATLVNTTDQTLSALVDDRRVVDLPLNGRNIVSLARILPGAMEVKAPQEVANTRDGPTVSFNGGRSNSSNFTLNGANFTSFARVTGMNLPPPDAVQEIRIQTHSFTAEFGDMAGAQVSVVSKAGTNQFHGSAWEFLRNEKLNARSFFQPRRPASKQNQAGFAAGGPVLKNRLFAFASYQRLWNRPEVGSSQSLVPTDAQRQGDFTATKTVLRNITDPLTGQPVLDPAGKPCVAGNIISPACISPAAKKLLGQYVPSSSTGVLVFQTPAPRDADTWMARIDFLQSAKHNMDGHYYRDHYYILAPGGIPGYGDNASRTEVWNIGINSTYTFSPSFLSQTRVSFLRSVSYGGSETRIAPRSMGIDLNEGLYGEGVGISVSGRFSLSFPTKVIHRYAGGEVRNTMSKIIGRHTLKWGYQMLFTHWYLQSNGNYRNFAFTGTRTGDATADFLLGAFDSLGTRDGPSDSAPNGWKHYWFMQDEFKVHTRFTLSYGLRYEPFFPWKQRHGRYVSFKSGVTSTVKPDSPPDVLFPGDAGVPNKTVENDLNNLAPRFGFAWDLFGNGKTSVRGGYGIFYDQIAATSVHQAEAPWSVAWTIYGGILDKPYQSVNVTPPGQSLTGGFGCKPASAYPGLVCPLFPLPAQIVTRESKLRTPYFQSFNLTLQRQLHRDLMVETSYVGKIGIKIDSHRSLNPAVYQNSPVTGRPPTAQNVNERVLYPETRGIISPSSRILGNNSRSWFHSLQAVVNKRFSRGFSIVGAYTLSKNLDTIQSPDVGNNAVFANPFNLNSIRGRSALDRRHVLSVSWVWALPGHFNNRVASSVLGGWTLTGIHQILSGGPLNFVMGTDVALDGTGNGGAQNALFAPGATLATLHREHTSRNDFIQQFFNTAAFVPVNQVPRGIYGDVGRNILSGPASVNSDIAVLKQVALREPLKLELRGEFFNAFNQVNFSNPNATVSSGSFGRITGAGSGRTVQVAVKLVW